MYTAKELSDALSVGNSTLRHWANTFNVPRMRKHTQWVYSEEARQLLETIKDMRNQECGYETITRRLAGACQESSGCQTESNQLTSTLIEESIDKAIGRHTELAEKYAKATYTIGQLEADNRHLQATIEALKSNKKALEEQVKCLPSQEQWTATQTKLEALKEEIEKLRKPMGFIAWLKTRFG